LPTDIRDRIENNVRLDTGSVWVLSSSEKFNYSDGIASERYLNKVFSRTNDLSSKSHELEGWIRDWPSEYHLSRKRSQLLSGFDFDKSKKVLEVGCGCGAITRFLGETFDDVVSIEGSLARARLARLRTKDMKNISILCGPFQEIVFKDKFDIVFCVGVFEYSGGFVSADDPYDAILQYFVDILNPDGILVLAIENQFGLKYFCSSKEDHTNRMFEGIEGYPHYGNIIKTFGYDELKNRLGKYFSSINYYFPYPDYKMPSCVISEKFLSILKAGELISNFKSRDYSSEKKPLFDENLVYLELEKNNMLHFFSNSFLIIAGKNEVNTLKLQALCILYSTDRAKEFEAVTRFIEHEDKSIWACKEPVHNKNNNKSDKVILHPTASKWEPGLSLQGIIKKRLNDKNIKWEELFSPCKIWVNKLKFLSVLHGNRRVIDGRYIDVLWKNSYIRDNECVFVDQEWVWHEFISINVVIIRTIYCFLNDISGIYSNRPFLNGYNTKKLIYRIAKLLGNEVNKADMEAFLKMETEFYSIIGNKNTNETRLKIKLFLWNKGIYQLMLRIKKLSFLFHIIKDNLFNYVFRLFPPAVSR